MCSSSYTKDGDEPPCNGCRNERPILGPLNELFDDVYRRVFEIRNDYGQLDYNALFHVMDIMNLTADQRLDIITKAVKIERIVAEKLKEKAESDSSEK